MTQSELVTTGRSRSFGVRPDDGPDAPGPVAVPEGDRPVPDSASVQEPHNLADPVRLAAARPDADRRPALRWQDRTVTWADLDARVDALARGLRALDLPPTQGHPARVAVALPNIPGFVAAFYAVARAGLVAVPVNPGYTARELRHVLADSRASVLIGTPEVAAAVGSVADDLPALVRVHVLGGSPGLDDLAVAGGPVEAVTGGEDLAVLLYTSGVEGDPKGAMLPHRALLANHAQLDLVQPPPVGPDDVVLLALPLFHAYGLNSGLGAVAYHAACGVLVERFDPAETARMIEDCHVTAVVGVPQMYVAWSLLPTAAEAFQSVRLAVSGGAPLDPAAARRFADTTAHPVLEGYGLTETAPVLTSTLLSPLPKPGSIGRPLPGVELRLVASDGEVLWRSTDEDGDSDDFEHAPDSPGTDPGEVVVRGPNLFSGYWPDGRGGPDADGWWPTGDVAYADAEGDLFLVDRIGELILVSGFNVYPHEVERVLLAHPAVSGAAVVGIPHPYTGQTVKAYVVTTAPVTAAELGAHCERNLARFKCPTAFEFASALPYSAIGKVRKTALRAETTGEAV
jgi:long-chain acyl-CoA synthetase